MTSSQDEESTAPDYLAPQVGRQLNYQRLRKFLQLLGRSPIKIWLQILLLLLFVAGTEFQIPALRAWIALLLLTLTKQFKIFSPSASIPLCSSLLCLCLFPRSYLKLSLPMSWLASLGISRGKTPLQQSIYCYLLLQPLIIPWGMTSPWSILSNAFITPLIGGLLFPLSFICFFLPGLTRIGDPLWKIFDICCQFLSPHFQSLPPNELRIPRFGIWIYALVINLIFLYRSKK